MMLLTALFTLALAMPSEGAATPEGKCQKGRYDAAAKYAQCQHKATGKFFSGAEYLLKYLPAIAKCLTKYTATWSKLQAKASLAESTCDQDRFEDNGDGTVTDWLTGLQWEQKTDDATIHDKDNFYTWNGGGGGLTAADGTAFTDFLQTLNSIDCFAGQCDWRLPTVAELQTILLTPYPCATSPCIDETVFGPTVAGTYWSATTSAGLPDFAWSVDFAGGSVGNGSKIFTDFVRAVRAGL
jgi:hypothetical protein